MSPGGGEFHTGDSGESETGLDTMDTGARLSEAFSLGLQSFDFRPMEVTIDASAAKTRTSRTLPLSPVTVDVVKKLVAKRHPSWGDNRHECPKTLLPQWKRRN